MVVERPDHHCGDDLVNMLRDLEKAIQLLYIFCDTCYCRHFYSLKFGQSGSTVIDTSVLNSWG